MYPLHIMLHWNEWSVIMLNISELYIFFQVMPKHVNFDIFTELYRKHLHHCWHMATTNMQALGNYVFEDVHRHTYNTPWSVGHWGSVYHNIPGRLNANIYMPEVK